MYRVSYLSGVQSDSEGLSLNAQSSWLTACFPGDPKDQTAQAQIFQRPGQSRPAAISLIDRPVLSLIRCR